MQVKMWKILLVVFLLMLTLSTMGFAHRYDRDDSDYPLRYIAYAVYPVGMAVEYSITRPIHWLVSRPVLSKIFGHEPRAEKEKGTYFEFK